MALACNENETTTTQLPTTPVEALKKVPLSNEANNDSSPLPDLLKGLSQGGCDNGPGDNGAASFFYTDLTLSEDSVSGEEQWLLFANEKWKNNNGADCIVKWKLSGTKTKPKACGTCNYGLQLTNQMDVTGSTCPKDIAKGETGQIIAYDVKLNDNGMAELFFSKSGKPFAQGYHSKNRLKVVTDMSCRWF